MVGVTVRRRRLAVSSLVGLVAVSMVIGMVPASATTDAAGLGFAGSAYGTHAFVGDVVVAGKTAVSGLGCTSTPGTHHENSTLGANVPPLFSVGNIFTSADAIQAGSTFTSKTTATVNAVSLLSGLITATELKASSASSYDGAAFSTSAAGTQFVNLSVLGGLVINPAPNTQINLPLLGHVVLNEQISKVTNRSASLEVNMIHVVITLPNLMGIPVGTEIIVSHAKSSLNRRAGTLDGNAYISTVRVGNLITSGPTAKVGLGCQGTNGAVKSNNIAGVNLPPALVLGEGVTTAQGTVGPSEASGETTATVQGADLLAGLVSATVVKADAHSFTDGVTFGFSSAGSEFVDLVVAGVAIGDDVDPNTRIDLAGIGTLWLYRVIERPNSIEVRMIEIIVDTINPLGILPGTVIRVAVAEASAH